MTLSPRRGPGGIAISSARAPSLSACDSASSFSYAPSRALPFACRARGARRTHSSSRASVRWRASLARSSLANRASFCSSQLE